MSEQIDFANTTQGFGLPLLYAGQSQKEFFVNEALTMIDLMLHCTVEGEAAEPPASPVETETWIVAENATGAWQGHDASIAVYRGASWTFTAPREGMQAYDLTLGQLLRFRAGWQKTLSVQEPIGGVTVDTQARAAVSELISALQVLGILPGA